MANLFSSMHHFQSVKGCWYALQVSVAKSFDAPIKLLFPRGVSPETGAPQFSMLGLGDIVIPGIFVALLLRHDAVHHFRTKYFYRCGFDPSSHPSHLPEYSHVQH